MYIMVQGQIERRSKAKQIASYYATLIDIGQIKEGALLPGRTEVADTWHVGLRVAQKALEVLRDTGYCVTVQRQGSYAVRPREVNQSRC